MKQVGISALAAAMAAGAALAQPAPSAQQAVKDAQARIAAMDVQGRA